MSERDDKISKLKFHYVTVGYVVNWEVEQALMNATDAQLDHALVTMAAISSSVSRREEALSAHRQDILRRQLTPSGAISVGLRKP